MSYRISYKWTLYMIGDAGVGGIAWFSSRPTDAHVRDLLVEHRMQLGFLYSRYVSRGEIERHYAEHINTGAAAIPGNVKGPLVTICVYDGRALYQEH